MEQSKNNDYLVIKENLIVNQNIDCEENLLVKDSLEINSGVAIGYAYLAISSYMYTS